MLVKNWMSKPALTVHTETLLAEAINLLQYHDIHILPVVEGNRLVGIVTDQDLDRAIVPEGVFSDYPDTPDNSVKSVVSEIMTTSPVTILENQTIEDTAELLLVHRISGLPVVNSVKELVGIITKSDLFRFIITTIGLGKSGVQFAFELVDQPERFNEVTDLIRDYGGQVGTVFSTCERAEKGYRQAYIRMYDIDPPGLARLKEIFSEKVKMRYIINYQEKMIEIF